LYAKPSAVENASLLIKGNSMCLKPNLMEHHDYVGLPQEVWRHITAWYSADWTIVRFLKKDRLSQDVFLDLYPSEVSLKHEYFRKETKEDGDGASSTND
jgi:hypothetical protein